LDLQALNKIGYGVYIVCSRQGNRFNGQIANSLFQITSEPPTVAVSINKKNLTHEFITESKVFTASVLAQETPLPFIGQFGFKSGRDNNKLENVQYKTGVTGAPVVLENAVSYIEAKVIKEVDVGTHTIFIGEVVGAEVVGNKATMTYEYYHQVKRGTTPKTAPSYIAPEKKEAKPNMDKYTCKVCGYVYDPALGDPDGGIKPGTPFAELPGTWVCPVCGAPKTEFEKAG
jgi:flavin reductase (DIM6/NTAB) family NADH-FMN oxidoreductase RutF/rubredoxin